MRKARLVDCNPRWGTSYSEPGTSAAARWLTFDCPEGHADCTHTIPFSPTLDGSLPVGGTVTAAVWQRSGDTFETLTLLPSILRRPRHANRDAAIAAGCMPEHITETMFCALHIFIRDGNIEFCGDSK